MILMNHVVVLWDKSVFFAFEAPSEDEGAFLMKNNRIEGKYTQEELDFIVIEYKKKTDRELLDIIRRATKELGRLPTKADIPAAYYFKQKFGPWPRVLEAAGVKPVSETYERREQARKEKHNSKRKLKKQNKKKSNQEK